MTKLAPFRARLRRLKRRRQQLRWVTAYSALAAGVLGALLVVLAADWALEMSRVQRGVGLALAAAAVVWIARRYTLPLLGRREGELDMALLVERQEEIDTDLVAAIQFESPEAAGWGSGQLETAVVDRVAEVQGRLNVFQGLSRKQAAGRTAMLAALAGLWVLVAAILPAHFSAFLDRLVFGLRHYPSNTRIDEIVVAGVEIDPLNPAATPVTLAYGAAVPFRASCSGLLPRTGEARLEAAGQRTIVSLAGQAARRDIFEGELSSLTESAEYRLVIGDARTEPGRLVLVPLPTGDLEMEVVPPTYAGSAAAGRMPLGLRQISVIEGSRVIVRLKAGKPLREAVLDIEDQKFALRRDAPGAWGDRSEGWVLDATGTPLAAVLSPLKFEIQVLDRDGLKMEQPLAGAIQIAPDQAPHAAVASLTPAILPTARPSIFYRASDDFGLARLVLVREVLHPDGTKGRDEVEVYRMPDEKHLSREHGDRHQMDLSGLKLVKGDKLKVSLRAEDYRGPRPGRQALSEPVVFQVTDQQGILSMMMEWDRKSAEQLEQMIQRQLGLGGTP